MDVKFVITVLWDGRLCSLVYHEDGESIFLWNVGEVPLKDRVSPSWKAQISHTISLFYLKNIKQDFSNFKIIRTVFVWI